MAIFDEINYVTGFANGDKWETADQIRDYFTIATLQSCFWQASAEELAALPSQETLDAWAELVIENHWHQADTD